VVGQIWKPYIGQEIGGELDLMVLIGGEEERAPNDYTFVLKMATAVFAETLDNSQHSTRLIPESPSNMVYVLEIWLSMEDEKCVRQAYDVAFLLTFGHP
jgi:hypothetical protein